MLYCFTRKPIILDLPSNSAKLEGLCHMYMPCVAFVCPGKAGKSPISFIFISITDYIILTRMISVYYRYESRCAFILFITYSVSAYDFHQSIGLYISPILEQNKVSLLINITINLRAWNDGQRRLFAQCLFSNSSRLPLFSMFNAHN